MKSVILRFAIFTVFFTPAFGQGDTPAVESVKIEEMSEFEKHGLTVQALNRGDVKAFLALTEGVEGDSSFAGFRADVLQRRAEQRFFDADIEGSLNDFDEVIALEPRRDPYNWQRGIALYYAGKYQDGKEQFERHQEVNSEDVENAVWHFLCAVRAPEGSVESAQKNLISISKDSRVPMKEIHKLFAGKGTAEDVLKAAKKQGNPKKSDQAKNALLYAHLYLGIYYEAIGKDELMKENIAKAVGEYKMNHYMGKVAQVHAKLRGL